MSNIHYICLLTLDRPKFTAKAWENVLDKSRWGIDPERVRVIWFDNGSSQKNIEEFAYLTRLYGANIEFCWHSQKNEGIAFALNRMMHYAFHVCDASYVTTVANDILEPQDWLAIREASLLWRQNAGVCSIKVSDAATVNATEWIDGNDRIARIGYESSRLISGNHTIRRSTWHRVGYYNEALGVYAPIDFDYCARCNADGLLTFQINSVRAEHLGKVGLNPKEYQAMKDAAHNLAAPEYAKAMERYAMGKEIYYSPFD